MSLDSKDLRCSMNRRQFLQAAGAAAASMTSLSPTCLPARRQSGPPSRLVLDLGTVDHIAEISVNGTRLTTLWRPPYQVDVTDALRAGENRLQFKVINQWTNRQIGDRLAPADKRVLTTPAFGPFGGMGGSGDRNPVPPPSALSGPVTVNSTTSQ